MRRPKISTFPLDKPFEEQAPTTPLSEIALRLVVNFDTDRPQVIGTATVLCGHLLLSAKHILEMVLKDKPLSEYDTGTTIQDSIVAVQVTSGPEYFIWNVVNCIAQRGSDLVLLQLAANPRSTHPNKIPRFRQPIIDPLPPCHGDRVAAFGYRKSEIINTIASDGRSHITLNDKPMMSVGIVQEVHLIRREQRMLHFPCYQINARFDPGMSGGPVFNEAGGLCGIITTGMDVGQDDEPISYASIIWPLFLLKIAFDRGEAYPRGVEYQFIELARGQQIKVGDLDSLEKYIHEQTIALSHN